LIETADLLAHW